METVEVERQGGVAIVRLNRPPVNAVNKVMMRELRSCFDAISQDREVGAAILSATGERAFVGASTSRRWRRAAPDEPVDVHALLDPYWEWRQTQYSIRECLVPVVGVIEHAAMRSRLRPRRRLRPRHRR